MLRPSKLENLVFIYAMLHQARQRARATGEDLFAYLIEMACLEAADRLGENGNIALEPANAP